MFCFPTLPI